MTTGYQIKEQDQLHFVTLQVVDWIDVFTRENYRKIIVENLNFCQKNKGLEIYGWVIMSNHIHWSHSLVETMHFQCKTFSF